MIEFCFATSVLGCGGVLLGLLRGGIGDAGAGSSRQCGISVAVSVFAHDGWEYLDGSRISDSWVQDRRPVAAGAVGFYGRGVRGAAPGPSGGSEC